MPMIHETYVYRLYVCYDLDATINSDFASVDHVVAKFLA